MPHYFFHTESHVRTIDTEGTELPDVKAARAAATKCVAEILKDNAERFWGSKPWCMTVTDAVGLILFSIEVHGQASPAVPD